MRYFKLFVLALALQSLPGYSADLIKVLIIDTGVDPTDAAIAQVACPRDDSLDAMRPTLVPGDDVGPNAPGHRGIPPDTHGHGTHVAGIIRALAGNSGYCLAYCKYYEPSNPSSVNLENVINCLRHAKAIGAQYVNYSSANGSGSPDEKAAIEALPGWFIAAAGNDGLNIDLDPRNHCPASYRLPNEVVVGSYNSNCDKTEASNWGEGMQYFIGDSIYSAQPGGTRALMSGTSMATAVATGVLLRARLGLPPIGSCKATQDFIGRFWRSH